MTHGTTYTSVVQTVGNTPLIRLRRLVPPEAAAVFVKCEFFNPMSSVKDRIGRAMIESAEQSGLLKVDTH